jgi:hypothetical protein
MQCRSEDAWRNETDSLIAPDVRGIDWDGFARGPQLIEAGEAAAMAALPMIKEWFPGTQPAARGVDERAYLPQSMPQEI